MYGDSIPVPILGRELPTFSLRQEDLPELRAWEIDGKYYLVLKVEMVAKTSAKMMGVEESSDKQKVEGTFKMLGVKALGNKPIDIESIEKADFEQTVAKVKSNSI